MEVKITLPDDVVAALDAFVAKSGYSRSFVMKTAVRLFLQDGPVAAASRVLQNTWDAETHEFAKVLTGAAGTRPTRK